MDEKNLDFEHVWDYVQKRITKLKRILEGLPETPFNSEEHIMLYTTIYNMCSKRSSIDHSQQFYDKYRETLKEYIQAIVLPSLIQKHDEFMLKELVHRWSRYKVMVRWLFHFFCYLDKYFIQRHFLPSLNTIGLTLFRDLVCLDLQDNVRQTMITLINKEREGAKIDTSLLKSVLDIFVEVSLGDMKQYQLDFERHMLDDTSNYYKNKVTKWIEVDSCSDYMLKAEDCLRREKDRVSHYLYFSTEQKLIEKVQHELLVTHLNQLLDNEHSGCGALLRDYKVEDLSRMYRLYHKIPKGLDLIESVFKQHIIAEGTTLVQQAKKVVSIQVLVKKFIELQYKYVTYVTVCFKNDKKFHKALKEAFEAFCNKIVIGSSSEELLAIFCDIVLKKGSGSENPSDEEIEETLEKVVKLFSLIDNADLFAEFYKKKLAHRLLFDKSANEDHEKGFLTMFKQEFGAMFTSKMERMVVDLTLAKDNQMKFEEYLRRNSDAYPGIDLAVTVLTTGLWPSYKSSNLNLPLEMVKCVEVFKGFYKTEHQHKKLTWIYSLGSCNILGKFEPKNIELVVSTYQAVVLLLFNTADRLSYSEIMTQLNLKNEDVVRLLHSLSCGKYKILVKEPNNKTVSPTDSFEFNSKFTDRLRRIKIPLPTIKEERKKVIEYVDKDRRYAIDAAIVRIMKSRKVLGHQQLLSECVEQLSHTFKPDIKAIKKRIDELINREYLERDRENPNTYRYLA